MIARQTGLGQQNGRPPHRADLLDRARAAATYDDGRAGVHAADRVDVGHLAIELVERAVELQARQALFDVGLRVVAAAVGAADPVQHEEIVAMLQVLERVDGRAVHGPRPLGAAEGEHQRLVLGDPLEDRGGGLGGGGFAQRGTNGIAHVPGRRAIQVAGGVVKTQAHGIREARHEAVQATGRRVLLVDEDLQPQHRPKEHGGEHGRGRDVAARRDHEPGPQSEQVDDRHERPEPNHDRPAQQSETLAGKALGPHAVERNRVLVGDLLLDPAAHADVGERDVRVVRLPRLGDRQGRVDMASGAAAGEHDGGVRSHQIGVAPLGGRAENVLRFFRRPVVFVVSLPGTMRGTFEA